MPNVLSSKIAVLAMMHMMTLLPLAATALATSALAASIGPDQHNMQNHMKNHIQNDGQMNHSEVMSGMKTPAGDESQVGNIPTEPGQGAFAAISQIVVLLKNDPMTDWDKVNIDALREHLVDMSELTLHATTKATVYDDRVVFSVMGSGRTLPAIRAMVPAHGRELMRITQWQVKSEITGDGAILTVSSDNPAELKIIKALGFFGIMATGAHHQAHHLAMAKGETSVHGDH